MFRKILTVFCVFSLLLFSWMPSVVDPDPYEYVEGQWTSEERDLYFMYGVTSTFSDDLEDLDKVLWLGYLQESLELLPSHLLDDAEGLLFSFNSGDTCVEPNYLACFTSHNFSVFMSTDKQERKRSNIKTILHEIAHAVDYRMDPEGPVMPEELHNNRHHISNYARTNPQEDFAESFAIYILSPGYMEANSKARYDFMRDTVFLGKEYYQKAP